MNARPFVAAALLAAAVSCEKPNQYVPPLDGAVDAPPTDAVSQVDFPPEVPNLPPPDAPPSAPDACTSVCTAGSRQCQPGGIATCAAGPSGCTMWGTPVQCPTAQVCKSDACTCPEPCTPDSVRCGANDEGTQRCVILGTCAIWAAEVPCEAPVNATATCTAGKCNATCKPGAVQCPGGALRCDRARWSFDASGEGWRLTPNGDLTKAAKGIMGSTMRFRSAPGALAIGVEVDPDLSYYQVYAASPFLCDPGAADFTGKKVTAAFYFDGPPLPADCCGCSLTVRNNANAHGLALHAAPGAGSSPLLLRPTPGNWQVVTGYYPPGVSPDLLIPPLSVGFECAFNATSTVPRWSGILYVDDVSVD
jgi:hypothetical protein